MSETIFNGSAPARQYRPDGARPETAHYDTPHDDTPHDDTAYPVDRYSVETVLTALRQSALALCADSPALPSWLRLTVGDVAVELGWPEPATRASGSPFSEVPAQRRPAAAGDAVPAAVRPSGTAAVRPSGTAAVRPSGTAAVRPNGTAAVRPNGTADGNDRGAQAGPGDPGLTYITSPTVGTFYNAPKPGAKPFVREGDAVVRGQQVAIVEVMKLMIPVEADTAGRIVAVLPADATAVEFGEPLFSLAPAEVPVG